jgi:hypothetical protein
VTTSNIVRPSLEANQQLGLVGCGAIQIASRFVAGTGAG